MTNRFKPEMIVTKAAALGEAWKGLHLELWKAKKKEKKKEIRCF